MIVEETEIGVATVAATTEAIGAAMRRTGTGTGTGQAAVAVATGMRVGALAAKMEVVEAGGRGVRSIDGRVLEETARVEMIAHRLLARRIVAVAARGEVRRGRNV